MNSFAMEWVAFCLTKIHVYVHTIRFSLFVLNFRMLLTTYAGVNLVFEIFD